MRLLLQLFVLAGAGYLALCLLAAIFQAKLIYFPSRRLEVTPREVDLDYEEIHFAAADGVALHGWFMPHPAARATLLFFHGNAGNISHRLDSYRLLHELGLAVFAIDYRGYGDSAGRPREAGLYLDAHAAWRLLTEERGIAAATIVLHGRSLGAALAIELAGRVEPAALIVESGFSSAAELGARVYPWLPVRLLLRERFDSSSRIGAIAAPKLFIHSRQDEVVPFALGRELYERASPPKEFLEIRGSHNEGWWLSRGDYSWGLGSFLDGLAPLAPRPAQRPEAPVGEKGNAGDDL